jgi:glycosyltransferase involved in cell wall biosynthesis
MKSTQLVGVMGSGEIGTDPYDENAWSGSSRYFFQECARQGLLHRAFGVDVPSTQRIALILRNFSLNRATWRRKFYLDTTYYDLLSAAIAQRLSPEDLEHSVLQIGGMYDVKPLLRPGCPVFSYHDGNLAQAIKSPGFTTGLSASRVQRALDYERRVYQKIDVVFTMSEYLRRSFIDDFGVDARKVKTIGAGINFDAFPPAPESKRYDGEKLVFVGADFARKGGWNLLKAFKNVRRVYPGAELSIIGPRNLTIPPELASGVNFVGFLSKNDPMEKSTFDRILRESSLFVLPSRYEPFGIAPLEAMAHQIPCVLTNAWAFPEMVEPGITGELVNRDDPEDLADKIIGLLRNPDHLRTMGRAGRELVLRKYTWRGVVARLGEELAARSSGLAR